MADVVMPDQFNEQFTLYLNTEGKPVKRTLREMTAAEVLLAMDWQRDEANRLNAEAAHARVTLHYFEVPVALRFAPVGQLLPSISPVCKFWNSVGGICTSMRAGSDVPFA